MSEVIENLVGTERPLWRDYSYYQQLVNFDKAKEIGVQGMAARATISWGYQDSWFPRNWEESKRVNMFRTSYHVLYPEEDILRQLDNWYKVHPHIDIIPRVIDLELEHDQTPNKIADVTWRMSEIIFSRDGIRPIIYSRYLLINKWLVSWTTEMLNMHFWWLAQYLYDRTIEHSGPPTPPLRVNPERIILHQTADKKLSIGETIGAVDYDRWCIGNILNQNNFIDREWIKKNESSSLPSLDETSQVKSLFNNLRVRKIPNNTTSSSTIVEYLSENEIVDVIEEKQFGDNIWLRIGYKQWIAKKHLGTYYVDEV